MADFLTGLVQGVQARRTMDARQAAADRLTNSQETSTSPAPVNNMATPSSSSMGLGIDSSTYATPNFNPVDMASQRILQNSNINPAGSGISDVQAYRNQMTPEQTSAGNAVRSFMDKFGPIGIGTRNMSPASNAGDGSSSMQSGNMSSSGSSSMQNPANQMTDPNAVPSNMMGSKFTTSQDLQRFNPYAVGGVGIDQSGFNAESAALKRQGAAMETAQRNYGTSSAGNEGQRVKELGTYKGQQDQAKSAYDLASKRYQDDLSSLQEKYPTLNRDQVVASWSTGKKALAGIGMILGGIGAGMTKSPNLAAEMINNNINSVIDANNQNFKKGMDVLNEKRALSMQDFNVTRQNINDNMNLTNQTFDAMQRKIESQYKADMAPAARAQLDAAAAQVQQRRAQAQLQADQFNLQLGIKAREFHYQMATNPLSMTIDVKNGSPVQVLANNETSYKNLSENYPKLQSAEQLLGEINRLSQSGMSGRENASRSNDLKNLMVEYAKARGIEPEKYSDILNTFQSNATGFVKAQLEMIDKEKTNLINANTRQMRFGK